MTWTFFYLYLIAVEVNNARCLNQKSLMLVVWIWPCALSNQTDKLKWCLSIRYVVVFIRHTYVSFLKVLRERLTRRSAFLWTYLVKICAVYFLIRDIIVSMSEVIGINFASSRNLSFPFKVKHCTAVCTEAKCYELWSIRSCQIFPHNSLIWISKIASTAWHKKK